MPKRRTYRLNSISYSDLVSTSPLSKQPYTRWEIRIQLPTVKPWTTFCWLGVGAPNLYSLADGHTYGRIDTIYGDWTWVEDDEKLFGALPPWIATGSYVVFESAEMKTAWYGVEGTDQYEAWEFVEGKIEHKIAKTATHFDWE